MKITAYDLAQRFVGLEEVPGSTSNPQILAMLKLDDPWPQDDDVPWCSAFVNYVAWLLHLPRSKSLRARSWLSVGIPLEDAEAQPGWDVVILKRGTGDQPGPEVIDAPGHVGWFGGIEREKLWLLAGNQGDTVSVATFDVARILGIRRIWTGRE